MLKSVSFGLVLAVAALSFGCGDDPAEDEGASAEEIERKCTQMCERIVAAPFSGCGNSDGASVDVCVPECIAHLNPKDEGEDPEATVGELDCAIDAPDCDAWNACGDFL